MADDVERLLRELPSKLEPLKDAYEADAWNAIYATIVAIEADFKATLDVRKLQNHLLTFKAICCEKFGNSW